MTQDFTNPHYHRRACYLKLTFSSDLSSDQAGRCLKSMQIKRSNKASGIYVLLNLKTNNFYVGSTVNFQRRLAQHLHSFRYGKSCNILMYRDVQKYGIDSMKYLFVQYCNIDELESAENFWMQSLQPTYNIVSTAKRVNIPKESRKNAGILIKEAKIHYASPVLQKNDAGDTVAEFNSIKEAAISFGGGRFGYMISKVCRGKMTHAFGYKWEYKNGLTPPKPKHIEKNIEKPVSQYTRNGIFIRDWPSMAEASIAINRSPDSIRRAIKQGFAVGGFIWKYKTI